MNEKLREAFGQVQAGDGLKAKTKDYIAEKTRGYTRAGHIRYRHLAAALVCVAVFFIGGNWLYFTPTVEISIDINPSLELGVNRYNRIISFESYNDEGQELLDSLDIKFMDYSEAVNKIIEDEDVAALLSDDEIMTIAVVGTDSAQSEEIFAGMQTCIAGRNNMYCYYAHSDEVREAHEVGLSYGKYKAFLEVQALDPDITAGQIKDMSMREIRDLIDSLSDGAEGEADQAEEQPDNGKGYGQKGNGSGKGEKRRRGKTDGW